jgi:hypothetical protein
MGGVSAVTNRAQRLSLLVGSLGMALLAGCGAGSTESTGTSQAGGATDAGTGTNADANAGGHDAAAGNDANASAPACTSGMTWMYGDHGSSQMNPGRACIGCHSTHNGPPLTIAGTIYPTAHEPDLCDGADGTTGALVVITGADGQTVTLTPNVAGNFDTGGPVKLPFTAKVTYMGRESAMTAMQTTGDCNSCHTQSGANGAPGRIQLP